MIEYITDKLHKFNTSKLWDVFDIIVSVGVLLCIACFIFIMVFAPISASAYSNDYFPLQVTFANPNNVPYESLNISLVSGGTWHSETELGTYTIETSVGSSVQKLIINVSDTNVTADALGTLSIVENTGIPVGTYEVLFYAMVEAPYLTAFLPGFEPDNFIVCSGNGIPCYILLDDGSFGSTYNLVTVENTTEFDSAMTMVLLPVGDDTPTECPTLEEQISNYNGTWSSFVDKIQANNNTLYGEYISTLYSWRDDGVNSVTLEQRLEEFEGDFDDLIEGLRISNPRLYEQYNELIDSTLQQGRDFGYSLGYNEGYDVGESDGYKNGYNSGLNKGQSDTFTKNFFTDFLGGVVEAIDSIHLYEHIREIDGGVSTVVEWYISPWTIFTSIICLIVVIIILKVWLGG